MSNYKLFADKLTDLEDELQRMRELCECSNEPEAAQAASMADEKLLELARVVIDRGGYLSLVRS